MEALFIQVSLGFVFVFLLVYFVIGSLGHTETQLHLLALSKEWK